MQLRLFLVCCALFVVGCTANESEVNAASIGDLKETFKSVSTWANGAWSRVSTAAGKAGKWFKENVHSARDLWGKDNKDLAQKVNDTVQLLQTAVDKVELPENLKGKMKGWISDLEEFKTKVQNSAESEFPKLEQQWQEKVRPIYNDGIQKLMGRHQARASASTAMTASIVYAFLTAIVALVLK